MRKIKREYFIIDTVVTELVKKFDFGSKIKTVFKCKSKKCGSRLCIIWSNPNIKVGDNIEMKGFFSGEAFIAQSLFIKKY